MKLRNLLVTAPVAAALCCTAYGARQTAGDPDAAEASSTNSKAMPKEKHWSGSLVDVGCMSKALGSGNETAAPQSEPGAGAPHFAGGDPQAGQGPGGGGAGGMGSGQRAQPPAQGMPPSEGTNSDDRARSDRANKLDTATKTCAASPTTQNVGLATSDGQLVQFDADGMAKAHEALKQADVQPGKKVKARVTGVMEDKNTVKVASVDVKGKGKSKGR